MRNYKKKTERANAPHDLIQRAVETVIEHEGDKNFTIRKVASDFHLHYSTLSRYVKKFKTAQPDEKVQIGYSKHKKIFTTVQEETLASYVKRSSEIMFGLTPEEVRKLAYQCAVSFNIEMPNSWITNRKAGEDWFSDFLKRNNRLSVRQPEATSLARCTSFNKENVSKFFGKLGDLYERHNLEPHRIWNMDETGVSTVLRPNKIVATKLQWLQL